MFSFLASCSGELLTCDELRRRSTSATQMFSITPALPPPNSFPRLRLVDESPPNWLATCTADGKPLTNFFSGRKSIEFMHVSTTRVSRRCRGGDHRPTQLPHRCVHPPILRAVEPRAGRFRPSLIPLQAGRLFDEAEHVAGGSRWYLRRRRVIQHHQTGLPGTSGKPSMTPYFHTKTKKKLTSAKSAFSF
jgi:hypothetical protein